MIFPFIAEYFCESRFTCISVSAGGEFIEKKKKPSCHWFKIVKISFFVPFSTKSVMISTVLLLRRCAGFHMKTELLD